jgi:hypothetical protein
VIRTPDLLIRRCFGSRAGIDFPGLLTADRCTRRHRTQPSRNLCRSTPCGRGRLNRRTRGATAAHSMPRNRRTRGTTGDGLTLAWAWQRSGRQPARPRGSACGDGGARVRRASMRRPSHSARNDADDAVAALPLPLVSTRGQEAAAMMECTQSPALRLAPSGRGHNPTQPGRVWLLRGLP